MGTLIYGHDGTSISFGDRFLAHLQLVIGAKLRRRESFFFSWRDDISVGDGRSTIWVDPSIPLYFKYASSNFTDINREWIDVLANSSNSTRGLEFLPEPGTLARNPSESAAKKEMLK